jgi:hypothetical protein
MIIPIDRDSGLVVNAINTWPVCQKSFIPSGTMNVILEALGVE